MSGAGWARDRAADAARTFKKRTVCPDCGEAILVFSGGRIVNATHNPKGITHSLTCTGGPDQPSDAA